jgi:hypothetical protein
MSSSSDAFVLSFIQAADEVKELQRVLAGELSSTEREEMSVKLAEAQAAYARAGLRYREVCDMVPEALDDLLHKNRNAGLAVLCRAAREAFFLRKTATRQREAEEEAIGELLGRQCPKKPRQLFLALCDGKLRVDSATGPPTSERASFTLTTDYRGTPPTRIAIELRNRGSLSEEQVIEIVYGATKREEENDEHPNMLNALRYFSEEAYEVRAALVRRCRTRLRQLVKVVNDRLKRRGVPLRIVRPYRGWLYLWHTVDVQAFSDAREDLAASAADLRLFDRDFEAWRRQRDRLIAELLDDEKGERGRRADLEACKAFLRAELAGGPKPVKVVQRAWEHRGGKPSTLKWARKQLRVKAFRQHGQWWIELPSKTHKT